MTEGGPPRGRRVAPRIVRMADEGQRALPSRSREQRLDALRHANDVRVARAQLKRQLALGERRLDELLGEVPEFARSAKVFDLVRAAPKLGPVRARQLLVHCGISETKTVGGLSERQRAALIALLRR